MSDKAEKAILYAAEQPSENQRERFIRFLSEKKGSPVELEWVKDESLGNGFKLAVGSEVYDWTREGLLRQFVDMLSGVKADYNEDVISLVRENVKNWKPEVRADEIGHVLYVGDGIAVSVVKENV